MSRSRLPPRHPAETTKVVWENPAGTSFEFLVTYGFDEEGRIKEVFCASWKGSNDVVAFANDACILLSRLLQHGETVNDLVKTLGENRLEGQLSGPASSVLGQIVRVGVVIEAEVLCELAATKQ